MTFHKTERKPSRQSLPNRRLSETRRVETPSGHTAFVTIGYDPAAPIKPREVFYSGGFRSGSDLEYHLHDLCILISLLLRLGVAVSYLSRSIATKQSALGGEEYASLAGWLVTALNIPPAWEDEYLASVGDWPKTPLEPPADSARDVE